MLVAAEIMLRCAEMPACQVPCHLGQAAARRRCAVQHKPWAARACLYAAIKAQAEGISTPQNYARQTGMAFLVLCCLVQFLAGKTNTIIATQRSPHKVRLEAGSSLTWMTKSRTIGTSAWDL